MRNPKRLFSWGGTALLTVLLASAAIAQGRSDAGDGSLSALTAELRQLRVAVEQLTRTQAQTQALGMFLSVQQGRIVQVAGRLDAVQKEFDGASVRTQRLQAQIAWLTRELEQSSEPQKRTQLDEGLKGMKAEQRLVDLEIQQIRTRETELSQTLQFEQARWNELVARLDRLVAQ